jgi:hypothetical protein
MYHYVLEKYILWYIYLPLRSQRVKPARATNCHNPLSFSDRQPACSIQSSSHLLQTPILHEKTSCCRSPHNLRNKRLNKIVKQHTWNKKEYFSDNHHFFWSKSWFRLINSHSMLPGAQFCLWHSKHYFVMSNDALIFHQVKFFCWAR